MSMHVHRSRSRYIIVVIASALLIAPAIASIAENLISVDASRLHSEYSANEVAADAKYKDRTLAVSGVVDGIRKDFLGNPYVEFGTENMFMGVQCGFGSEDASDLASLRKGDPITIIGKCRGMILGNVFLKDCVLRQDKPRTEAPVTSEKPQDLETIEKNLDKLVARPHVIPPESDVPLPGEEKPKQLPRTKITAAEVIQKLRSNPPSPQPQPAATQKDTRTLKLVYSGPMADFFIASGDIKGNMQLFATSGCFKVELHSKYKGEARADTIKDIKKTIDTGEVIALEGKGNPDLFDAVVTVAFFNTKKKTVTFSGKQSYLDMNNATIGTREIQETYHFDSPRYATLGKVASSIESLLQSSEGARAQRDIVQNDSLSKGSGQVETPSTTHQAAVGAQNSPRSVYAEQGANKMPGFDISKYCKSIGSYAHSYSIEESCVKMEKAARDELLTRLADISADILQYCAEIGEYSGGSYSLLQSCIKMEVEAKFKLDHPRSR